MSTGTSRPLPAVVWDMGGIMYRYFTEVVADLAAARGWPLDGVPLGPTGTSPDAAYEAMTQGRIDEPTYLEIVTERLRDIGVEVDLREEIHWPDQTRPRTWEVIAAVAAARHPQALLTNDATAWLGHGWWNSWEPAGWFDELVDVATVGVRKPAPEPYLAAADALGLPTSDCLFVDDMVVNCRGAEAVGMASHHVDIREADASLQRLARRLGLDQALVPR